MEGTAAVSDRLEERVLVLLPGDEHGEDAELRRALRSLEDVPWEGFSDLERLTHSLRNGAAALLLAEEAVASPDAEGLLEFLESQPPWSELPVLLVTREGCGLPHSTAERLGRATHLPRPVPVPQLAAAVRSALRSRRRQYRVREYFREREAAETAVREGEEWLRFSLDAGRLGMWQHDLRTDALTCSDLCKAHFGRAPEEPLSHDEVLALVHPEDRERVRAAIRAAVVRRERYALEYRVVWPDGSLHWLMVRGRASYDGDGRPVSTLGVTLDVTERKEAEARQKEQAERLRLLSGCAERLLATEDPASMIRELFERVRRELDLDVCIIYLAEPGSGSPDTPGMLRLASCAGLPEELEARIRRVRFGERLCGAVAESRISLTVADLQSSPDPRAVTMRELGMRACTCHPLLVGDRLLGVLAFAVRSRDRFTDEEVEFLRTISHYVALAQERARVEESLRETARRKDEFLAMLAHELRNPLSPVVNAMEIMRARPGRDQGEKARALVERQMRHMGRLIDDLLDVSRINTGKITLKRERLDLVAALELAVEGVRGFVAECGHTLETRFPKEPVYVDVDPVRLEQVVANLLNNAAKYTEAGGRIDVVLEAEAESARIRVRDTGIGIPAGLLAQVFDLFTQGERGLDRSQGGLGLGLTLVRNLVRLHDGTVEAFSDGPGEGSEFVVTLPLAPPAVMAPTTLPETPKAVLPAPVPLALPIDAGSPRRLLIVDDNRDSAETLAELAEIWGYEVDTAFDGVAALRRASEWEPSLVLLDIGMPGLNGYEVARQLRADGRFEHATLVALTGYGQEEDIERSRAAGFDHHLVKPIDADRLQELLRTGRAGGNGRG